MGKWGKNDSIAIYKTVFPGTKVKGGFGIKKGF
jgi:hypothetical protein